MQSDLLQDFASLLKATADPELAAAKTDICAFAQYVMRDPSGNPFKLKGFHKRMLRTMVSHRFVVIEAFRGSGKLQPYSSTVVTPQGLKTIGELREGDRVTNPRGGSSGVILTREQGLNQVYKVTMEDGSTTRAGGEHLWLAHQPMGGHKRYWNIMTTLGVRQKLAEGHSIRVPLTDPVSFAKRRNKPLYDPRGLGLLLGDGSISGSGILFTTTDAELVAHFGERAVKTRSLKGTDWRIRDERMGAVLRNVGLKRGRGTSDGQYEGRYGARAWEKFIPVSYKYGTIEERFDLVTGLMDTDGTVDAKGHATYTTTSRMLAMDVQWMLRSLGYRATIGSRIPTFQNGKGREAYTLYIQGPDLGKLFRLSRKRDRCRQGQTGFTETNKVISVEEDGEEQCRCIVLDNGNGLYLTDDFVVTHNSNLTSICYPLWLIMKNKDVRILLVTASDSLSKQWIREIEGYMMSEYYRKLAGDLIPDRREVAAGNLKWGEGEKIIKGRSPDAGGMTLLALGVQGQIRGRRADVVICDDVMCLAPETKVLTSDGWQPVRCVRVGQTVLSKDGRWHLVQNVSSRPQHEPMVKVSVTGLNDELAPVVTKSHPVLALQPTSSRALGHVLFKKPKIPDPQWVLAGDLSPGDYVALPIPNPDCPDLDSMWAPYGASWERGRHTDTPPPPNDLLSRSETWWLLGLWAADGTEYTTGRLTFALSSRETHLERRIRDYASRLQRKLCTAFGPGTRIPGFSCKPLTEWIRDTFRRPDGSKWIPPWVLGLPEGFQREFLRGYMDGDGSVARKEYRATIVSKSRETLLTLRLMALRCGMRSSLAVRSVPERLLGEATLPAGQIGALTFGRDWYGLEPENGPTRIRDGWFWARVRKVSQSPDVGEVYDIAVEGAKSFLTTSLCAHNSESNSFTPYQRDVLDHWFHTALLPTLDHIPTQPLSGQCVFVGTPLYDADLLAKLREEWKDLGCQDSKCPACQTVA